MKDIGAFVAGQSVYIEGQANGVLAGLKFAVKDLLTLRECPLAQAIMTGPLVALFQPSTHGPFKPCSMQAHVSSGRLLLMKYR